MTELDPFAIWCPTCGAKTSEPCKSVGAGIVQRTAHKQRVTEARRRRDGMPSSPGLQRHTPIRVVRSDKPSQHEATESFELPPPPKVKRPRRNRGRRNGFTTGVRNRIRDRAGGRCEARVVGVCAPGEHQGGHAHHVVLRSVGGPDTEENGMWVCWQVHDWIHQHGGAQAQALGLLGGHGATPQALRALRFEARTLEGELTPAA